MVAARDGVPAATIRQVAAQAGVSLGVVHYCFTGKDELFVEMAGRIVAESVAASSAVLSGLADLSGAELEFRTVMGAAADALWQTIVQTPGRQLLSYEITTHSLRRPDLNGVARRQYDAAEEGVVQFLNLIADVVQISWAKPVTEIAGSVLAYIDGVSLRWLVDADDDAGRRRLDDMVEHLAMMVAE